MLGVRLVDWIVIIVYLVGITFIGLWAVRKVRSSTIFFIGDRKFGKLMMAFLMFGTGTHSDQAVSVAAKGCYTDTRRGQEFYTETIYT